MRAFEVMSYIPIVGAPFNVVLGIGAIQDGHPFLGGLQILGGFADAFAIAGIANAAKGSYAMWRAGQVATTNLGEQAAIQAGTKGNPAAIYMGFGQLSSRQSKMLVQLPNTLDQLLLRKSAVNATDIAALTAHTLDEFTFFTRGPQRLIVRGNSISVPLTTNDMALLGRAGWRWSAHTHPQIGELSLMASGIPGDRSGLLAINQTRSLILNAKGRRSIFDLSNNYNVP